MSNSAEKLTIQSNVASCRLATLQDVDTIHAITTEAFVQYARLNGNVSVAALEETLEDIAKDLQEKTVFIAELDGIPVGVARCELIRGEDGSQISYLSRFAVKLDVQNKGIGSLLLQSVLEFSQENQSMAVCLHTSAKTGYLARFYYRNGFFVHSVQSERGYYRALFVHELNEKNEVYDYAKNLLHK